MKFMITCLIALGMTTASFATKPKSDCNNNNKKKVVKTAKSPKKLRRVIDANPQHAGSPKADAKGNYPRHIDKHIYYL